jgi:hypothetical protein
LIKPEGRTTPCNDARRVGRLAKAKQFADAAETVTIVQDTPDQYVDVLITLYVHAGIAAADVICCARLGRHARGENHEHAVRLLEQVDKKGAGSLEVLLGMKTRAGYGSDASSKPDLLRARRAADNLLKAATDL